MQHFPDQPTKKKPAYTTDPDTSWEANLDYLESYNHDNKHFAKQLRKITQHTRSVLIVHGYLRSCAISISLDSSSISDLDIPIAIPLIILVFYVTKYEIYGIGRQESGEFGMGVHHTQKEKYIRLAQHEKYLLCSPWRVFRGKERLQILSDRRQLYAAGFNERGECGADYTRFKLTFLCKTAFWKLSDDHIDKKTAWINLVNDGVWTNTTIVRMANGDFWAYGVNHHGEFGDNYKSYDILCRPVKCPHLSTFFDSVVITKIASGFEHTLFLTANGELYATGNNDIGQCGMVQLPDTMRARHKQFLSPQRIRLNGTQSEQKHDGEAVIDMSCGEDFNLVLSENHNVYVFGNNSNGALGLGANAKRWYAAPTLHHMFNSENVEKYGKVTQVECGRLHSCVVNAEGIGWLFGYNGYGQIGNGHVSEWNHGVKQPHCFQASHNSYQNLKIKQVSLGSDHTVIATVNNNRIITFGGNEHHQCSPNNPNQKVLFPHFLHYDEIGLKSAQTYERVLAGTRTTIIFVAKREDRYFRGL